MSFERLLCRLLLFFERPFGAALLFAAWRCSEIAPTAISSASLGSPGYLGDLGVPALTLNPRSIAGLLKVTADLS